MPRTTRPERASLASDFHTRAHSSHRSAGPTVHVFFAPRPAMTSSTAAFFCSAAACWAEISAPISLIDLSVQPEGGDGAGFRGYPTKTRRVPSKRSGSAGPVLNELQGLNEAHSTCLSVGTGWAATTFCLPG